MEENDKRFERENLAVTTSFSQLLFAADEDDIDEDDATRRLGFDRIFYADKTPRMLCFGDYAANKGESVLFTETTTTSTTTTTNKSTVTCSDSSSSASSTKSNTRKRCVGPERETVQCSSMITGNTTTTTSKKTKSEPANNIKRKEKLGERIAALQQLVSPFGKTDTASVLHEAMGYIRFLQEQVQVLCSPYLQRFPDSTSSPENGICGSGGTMKGLRSRGLCLVPVELTEHVTNENGADLWSPATLGHVSTKH